MQGSATLRRRRLTLKIRISYIVIRIYKLVVEGTNPRALASRIFEPRRGAAANRQARERLLTNEIQIEPRL